MNTGSVERLDATNLFPTVAMGEAYRRRGASGAVDVLDSYLAGFEAERSACGLPALDLNDIAHNLDWPASIEADPDQIAEIRAAFVGRRNLA